MPPEDIPAASLIYGAILLLAGLACLIHFAATPRHRQSFLKGGENLAPWPLPTGEFLLAAAALGASVMLVQTQVALWLMGERSMEEATAADLFWLGLVFHLTALAVFLFFRLNWPDRFAPPFSAKFFSPNKALRAGLYLFLLSVPLITAISLAWKELLTVAGLTADRQETVTALLETDSTAAFAGMILLTTFIAPVTEELLFRGCLYRFLKGKTPVAAAMVVSSLLFAVMHQNLFAFVPLFLLGLILTLAYERTGNLWVPVFLHGIFNFNTIFMLLLLRLAS